MGDRSSSPSVIASLYCAVCTTGYVPTPEEVPLLAGIKVVAVWLEMACRYAIRAGWYQRTDGQTLCPEHADHGDGVLRTVTVAEWRALLAAAPKRTHLYGIKLTGMLCGPLYTEPPLGHRWVRYEVPGPTRRGRL